MSTAIRQRLARAGSAVGGSKQRAFPLSVVEIVFVVIALGLVITAVVYYIKALVPERDRLRTLQAQKVIVDTPVATPSASGPSAAQQVQEALDSLQSFRHDHLTSYGPGRIALIDEINTLIKKHSLQLTSGIDMTAAGFEQQQSEEEKKSEKGSTKKARTDVFSNVYPNLTVRLTAFGQYNNLLAFIADLEKNKTFVIVDSMSLTNQEQKVTSGRGSRSTGISGLALTVDLTAYFRTATPQAGE